MYFSMDAYQGDVKFENNLFQVTFERSDGKTGTMGMLSFKGYRQGNSVNFLTPTDNRLDHKRLMALISDFDRIKIWRPHIGQKGPGDLVLSMSLSGSKIGMTEMARCIVMVF